MERMEYIDLRKVGKEGLKEIRGQVVRLKELGKTGKEGVSNCEIVERGFSPKGRPPVLPVETKRQRVNMISAISSQGSVRFMERLMRTSEQKVFLILDNLKVHHGKLAAAWLKKNKEKMEVFFLPPYAPEYNPDEYLNHALKISVHSGQLPYTTEDISHKIQSFMRRLQHHPSLFPVSSSTRRFPIFTRRSNIDIAVMRLQLFTTGAMIEAPVFINLAPDFPFIWLTIAGL